MMPASETRPVNVTVDLPEEMVEDIERVHQKDPDFFGRAIQYALARRIIFEELTTTTSDL